MDLVETARSGLVARGPDFLLKAEAAIESLVWLRDNRPAAVLAHTLLRDPAVMAVQAAFPEAKITAIRRIGDVE